jgi:DMSO/TMAO reductase YedYZ molybdopterin-dependent catalytic subunit
VNVAGALGRVRRRLAGAVLIVVAVEAVLAVLGRAPASLRLADLLVEVTPGGVATWFLGTFRGAARPLTALVAATLLVVAVAAAAATAAALRPRRDAGADGPTAPTDPARRRLVGGLAAGAGLLGAAGLVRAAGAGGSATSLAPTAAGTIPEVVAPLPAVSAAQDLAPAVPGLSPVLTPVADFYRIDTAMVIPRVDVGSWRLRIHGMVEREVTLTFDELVDLGLVERDVTISCVSNEVGGDLVGTQRWTGVPLARVLDLAGPLPGATQLVGRSVDGWTAGFPTALLTSPDALVAVAMGGVPLPARHGFPARLVVAGLFGYVSATKWLAELELTTWEDFDGFWIDRGWSKEGPVKTAARIDVPRDGLAVRAGTVTAAGVAWAPGRGIRGVEVRVDDGPWRPATLSEPLADTTWVQWTCDLPLEAGTHDLQVRAVDGTGAVQPEGPRAVLPDGAEGWHRRTVEVI